MQHFILLSAQLLNKLKHEKILLDCCCEIKSFYPKIFVFTFNVINLRFWIRWIDLIQETIVRKNALLPLKYTASPVEYIRSKRYLFSLL